jgi:putative membrane protein insertion efficiency factor
MIRLVLWYQRSMEGRPSPCRFTPSCSEYSLVALRTHGPWRGLWLTLRRLSRCRPFGPSGWDPVPDPPVSSVCTVHHLAHPGRHEGIIG